MYSEWRALCVCSCVGSYFCLSSRHRACVSCDALRLAGRGCDLDLTLKQAMKLWIQMGSKLCVIQINYWLLGVAFGLSQQELCGLPPF